MATLVVIGSLIALLVISVTMFARANDLKWDHCWHTHVRRIGLILAGSSPIGIAASFLHSPPTFYHCIFYIGLAGVFITTPNQVPWWRFMSRGCLHET